MVSASFEAKPLQRRVQSGGASLPGVSGGVPLINYQTGWVGGKNQVTLVATIPRVASGRPEGRNPFGRGLGVSPEFIISPFLLGRELGGWCDQLSTS